METRNGKTPRTRTTKGDLNGPTKSDKCSPGTGADNGSSRGNAAALAVYYDTASEIQDRCQETLDNTQGAYSEGFELAEEILKTLDQGFRRGQEAYGEAQENEAQIALWLKQR